MLGAVDPIKTSLVPWRNLKCCLEELTLSLFHLNIWAHADPSACLTDLSHDFRSFFLENISQFKLEKFLCIGFELGASDDIVKS